MSHQVEFTDILSLPHVDKVATSPRITAHREIYQQILFVRLTTDIQ